MAGGALAPPAPVGEKVAGEMAAGMSASIRKYTFDVSFDTDPPRKPRPAAGVPAKSAKKEPPPPPEPPPPTFTQAELEQARKKAYAEGEQAGRKAGQKAGRSEAEAQINQRIAAALTMIGSQMGKLVAKEEERAAAVGVLPVQLTLALMQKLFPHYAERHGLDEIEALAKQALEDLLDQPRVTVTVGTALAEGVRERLEPMLAERGFTGRLSVVADDKAAPTACRVEWPGGGVERDPTALIARAEEAAQALLAAAAPAGPEGEAVGMPEAAGGR